VEQICDRAIIIEQGRLVAWVRSHELLGTGDQAENLIRRGYPRKVEACSGSNGRLPLNGTARRAHHRARHAKGELVEKLWASGFDVVSMDRVRSSLEELYLKLIEPGSCMRFGNRPKHITELFFGTAIDHLRRTVYCTVLLMNALLGAKAWRMG